MIDTLILIGLATVGILLHILIKWRDAVTQGMKLEWKKHFIFGLISVLTSGVIIFLREDIKELFEVTRFSALFLGYFSDSVWKNMTSFYGNKLKIE